MGSQLGRFTQLSASNIVTAKKTIKASALLRRMVGIGKNLGKIDMVKPSFLVNDIISPVLASQHRAPMRNFPIVYNRSWSPFY